MRKIHLGFWMVVVWLGMICCGSAQPVLATGASFTVAPQLTANQMGNIKGYFNLKLAPQQTDQIAVTVTNITNQSKTIRVQPVNASTANNGTLSYDPGTVKDPSAKYRFTELVTDLKPVTIKLPAKTQKVVTYTVTMPKAAFTGQILGGLRVEDTAGYAGKSTGVGVVNHFAMVVAVQLQNDPAKVAPKLHLREVKVGVQDHQAAVLATLQNSEPRLFNQMSLKAKVTKRGETKALISRTGQQLSMAPNSRFTYAVFSQKALVAGQYTLHIDAKAQEWQWQFSRNFTITRQQAATTNRKANLKVDRKWQWVWFVIVSLLVLIAILLFLLLRRRHQSKKE
ncbi:DUF916 and DUF3324 domain-containing protein [Lacticaseibacillus porcinae]|uniref:DUF916 and DUF3324 domain-containing protein n=1 Tax=Lacticaseibacillus porcinae TaxID=1123687 RepID=UPI000F79AEA1|nr:DUF916 and DUF3324 domain-containing protein [Lacticaseibacillus porcinae]